VGSTLAWELWRRHRLGFRAMGAYLLLLAATKLVIVLRHVNVVYESETSFALMVVGPITISFVYLLAVFSYGLSGDIAARQSMYPARMFTLPVSNAALTGWPMLFGALATMGLWVLTRWISVWPSQFVVPYVWPATLAVALLLWTQALVWMPYGLPGLRLILAVLALGFIDAIVLLALEFKASEWQIVAITLPQIPVAYVLGRIAVARARRGVVPDWRLPRVTPSTAREQVQIPRFARDDRPLWLAARAQSWYEWRRHGRSLPAWVAIIVPIELLLLGVVGVSTSLLIAILLGALVTPVVVATFAAASVSATGASASDAYGMSPFLASRPLTDAQLLAAKLRMTVRSTLAAWATVLVAVPIGLSWSGTWPILLDWLRSVAAIIGVPRTTALMLVIVCGAMLSTWRQLVQSLCVGLTGSDRLIKGSVFGSLVLVSLLGPLAVWVVESGQIGVVWSAMPLILVALVCAKMIAAVWVAARLTRVEHPPLSDRALIAGAACWTIAVLTLYALLAWMTDAPHFPRYLVMLLAILSVPLARLSAAPLAIARNRHR